MKYTFVNDGIAVVNGELIEQDGIEVEYNFTLKMNALKLFEMEYGKPLLKSLMEILRNVDGNRLNEMMDGKAVDTSDGLYLGNALLDEKFIRALACATYVKVEGNEAFNNEMTVEEFKSSFVYDKVVNDADFAMKLITMSCQSILDKKKKGSNTQGKK